MNAQIAQHLNVSESAILEIQEWARVLWVRVKGIGARFVSKKVIKMEAQYIELESNRSKGLNAYLSPVGENDKADMSCNMYGEPKTDDDKQKAHRSKRHTVRVRIDNLPDGKYQYKEAGGADFNRARYGWIQIENGKIVAEG